MDQREPSRQDSCEDTDYDENVVSMGKLEESYQALLGEQHWEVDVPGVSAEPAETGTGPTPEAGTDAVATAPPPLDRIIEALLFVGGQPLTAARACEVVRGLTPTQFRQTIDSLNRRYHRQNRPYLIQPATLGERNDSGRGRRDSEPGAAAGGRGTTGPGYVMELRPFYQPILNRLFGSVREARLSPQAVDVLALVAYRQPVTKQEIDGIRGAESGSLLRQLLRHGLIAITRRCESGQREVCYGTTARFLELFRLRSLEELPQTQDLQRL